MSRTASASVSSQNCGSRASRALMAARINDVLAPSGGFGWPRALQDPRKVGPILVAVILSRNQLIGV